MDQPYVYHAPELNETSSATPTKQPLNFSKIRKALSITTFLFVAVSLPAVLFAVQFRSQNVQFAGSAQTIAISSATLDTKQTPWIIHLTGDNFSPTLKAKVFDNTTQWGEDLPITYKTTTTSDITFPYTTPPSHCVLNQSCIFRVQIIDTTNNLESTQYSIAINQ